MASAAKRILLRTDRCALDDVVALRWVRVRRSRDNPDHPKCRRIDRDLADVPVLKGVENWTYPFASVPSSMKVHGAVMQARISAHVRGQRVTQWQQILSGAANPRKITQQPHHQQPRQHCPEHSPSLLRQWTTQFGATINTDTKQRPWLNKDSFGYAKDARVTVMPVKAYFEMHTVMLLLHYFTEGYFVRITEVTRRSRYDGKSSSDVAGPDPVVKLMHLQVEVHGGELVAPVDSLHRPGVELKATLKALSIRLDASPEDDCTSAAITLNAVSVSNAAGVLLLQPADSVG